MGVAGVARDGAQLRGAIPFGVEHRIGFVKVVHDVVEIVYGIDKTGQRFVYGARRVPHCGRAALLLRHQRGVLCQVVLQVVQKIGAFAARDEAGFERRDGAQIGSRGVNEGLLFAVGGQIEIEGDARIARFDAVEGAAKRAHVGLHFSQQLRFGARRAAALSGSGHLIGAARRQKRDFAFDDDQILGGLTHRSGERFGVRTGEENDALAALFLTNS